MEGHQKFLGGGGQIENLEAHYEATKLDFPGGRGRVKKNPSMEGVRIFSGTAHTAP